MFGCRIGIRFGLRSQSRIQIFLRFRCQVIADDMHDVPAGFLFQFRPGLNNVQNLFIIDDVQCLVQVLRLFVLVCAGFAVTGLDALGDCFVGQSRFAEQVGDRSLFLLEQGKQQVGAVHDRFAAPARFLTGPFQDIFRIG